MVESASANFTLVLSNTYEKWRVLLWHDSNILLPIILGAELLPHPVELCQILINYARHS